MPLPGVTANSMRKVMEYLAHHANNAVPELTKPLKSVDLAVIFKDCPWDGNYVETLFVDQAVFFDVTLAANYLAIESLLDLCCARLAAAIKSKTPKEIREFFNIPEPTAEEEEAIKKQNQWIYKLRPAGVPTPASPVPQGAAVAAEPET